MPSIAVKFYQASSEDNPTTVRVVGSDIRDAVDSARSFDSVQGWSDGVVAAASLSESSQAESVASYGNDHYAIVQAHQNGRDVMFTLPNPFD